MSLERGTRPLVRCMRCTRHNRTALRSISTTPARQAEITTEPPSSAEPPPPPPPSADTEIKSQAHRYDPETVSNPRRERKLIRDQNQYPIGSRRRRAALASSANIPFQELPYQCFQEARKILNEDRAEKVAEIEELRGKIAKWSAEDVPPEKEARREERIKSWNQQIERLKILADINDPLVKKKFEDGMGDMSKPIYRHLSDLKWRSHQRPLLMQRITQMKLIPDVLPGIDPKVYTVLAFGKHKVPHGDYVLTATSEQRPRLEIQSYEKGKKLVSIAVVTPDVPNVAKDGFDYRCHFLAVNVEIEPTKPSVDLRSLSKETNIVQGWAPPYSQKGAPYQRLGVFILEQPSAIPAPEAATKTVTPADTKPSFLLPTAVPQPLDISAIRKDARYTTRENFILRSFATKYNLKPIGVDMFRTVWDETTAGVMQRHGIVGWDVEFKRKKVEPLPYQRLKAERYR